jgi:hypothetical protein
VEVNAAVEEEVVESSGVSDTVSKTVMISVLRTTISSKMIGPATTG